MPGFAVTRGFGPGATPSSLVARGFAAEEVVEFLRGSLRKAKQTKHQFSKILEELKISVSLIAINGKDLVKPIINTMRTSYDDKAAPQIEVTPIRLAVKQPDIKVKVTSIRSEHVSN